MALPTAGAVPGIQLDGYFPDTSTSNSYRLWNHDAQFVIDAEGPVRRQVALELVRSQHRVVGV